MCIGQSLYRGLVLSMLRYIKASLYEGFGKSKFRYIDGLLLEDDLTLSGDWYLYSEFSTEKKV